MEIITTILDWCVDNIGFVISCIMCLISLICLIIRLCKGEKITTKDLLQLYNNVDYIKRTVNTTNAKIPFEEVGKKINDLSYAITNETVTREEINEALLMLNAFYLYFDDETIKEISPENDKT